MDRLKSLWVWAVGEVRPPDEPLRDPLLLHLVGVAVCFALFGGELFHINDAELLRGSWMGSMHGGIPLAALVMWGLVRQRAGVLPWLATLAGTALVMFLTLVRIQRGPHIHRLKPYAPEIAGLVLLGFVLLAVAAWRGKVRLGDFGLGLGDWRWWGPRTIAAVVVLGILGPVALLVFPDLQAFYPAHAHHNAPAGVIAETQFAMVLSIFGWEMLFRGVLLFVLARRGDVWMAIEACAIVFFLGHLDKPFSELALSLPGGIIAGIFAWRARSFLPVWILHAWQLMLMNVGAWIIVD